MALAMTTTILEEQAGSTRAGKAAARRTTCPDGAARAAQACSAVKSTDQTVFIVEDHPGSLTAVDRLLRSSGYPTECYRSGEELLACRPPERGGCAVVDLVMPGMDGMGLLTALAESPNPLPVVFLTGKGDVASGVAAIREGAEDYLLKTVPAGRLLTAIDRALARYNREREERARIERLRTAFAKLTPREREVLSQVLQGRLNKHIAIEMGIDERSVKRHRTHFMRKLAVSSVVQLVRIAIDAGIIDPRSGH